VHTLYVVSHTHWDREWYEPFQVYRARLIRCVDKLLDVFASDPDYQYFLLDGQTIVLEDYLEVRPDREKVLRELVKSGRLQIGPWYVLPDEFLVSGEAIIRNLARGIQIARDFGDTQPEGYIPDPFGHISQMPQILHGFQIDAAVFRRGLADEPTEVAWQAPDGSQVLACYLRDGYDNAAWLGHDDASFVRNLDQAWHSLAAHAVTPNILLLNGNDHMEPWADLSHLLRVAREQLGEVKIIHASLPMYVAQVQADIAAQHVQLGVAHGELRNPKRHHLLPGVLSTRMWIKQRNARAQRLLEKWAEPFATFADLENRNWKLEVGSTAVQPPTSNLQLLHLAWKYLLYNHPHDSICGCGVDQMHAEMALRFDWVEQIVEPIIAESLAQLAASVDTHTTDESVPVVVFNPVAGPRTDRVVAQIELPTGWENFTISDAADTLVPFQILSQRVDEYYHKHAKGESLGGLLGMVEAGRIMGMAIQNVAIFAAEDPIRVDVTLASQGDPHPALQQWQQQLRRLAAENPTAFFEIRGHSPIRAEVEFVACDVPGYGYKTFTCSKVKPLSVNQSTPDHSLVLENEFYRVEPNPADGTLTITDKSTRMIYRGLNHFVDGGDRGDLYNYCPPENDRLVCQPALSPQITGEKTAVQQSLHLSMVYQLPTSLTFDRTGRSAETIETKIDTVVSLYPGVRRINFQTRVDNPARDHRLQVEFPTSIVTAHVEAEQAFDVVRRPIDLPLDTADWIEQPRPEAPLQNFVSISNGQIGLTLATRGLPEYQAQREAQGTTLLLTLLRCVSWLSRDDLSTRSGHAGPALETPGAQEIGPHVFEYALMPTDGDWRNAFADAHAFIAPLRAVATSVHAGALPSAAGFIEVTPREFVISAIKRAEDGTGLIVRGYNISDQSIDVTLRFQHQVKRIARTNLYEEEIAPLDRHAGYEVTLPVRGKEITTLKGIF
jgi:alpha-mannosidase